MWMRDGRSYDCFGHLRFQKELRMSDLQVEDEAGEEWEERASLLHFGIREGSEGEGNGRSAGGIDNG